jgi:hypothetical protein
MQNKVKAGEVLSESMKALLQIKDGQDLEFNTIIIIIMSRCYEIEQYTQKEKLQQFGQI